MPELPEVETTVRGLERVLKGRRIARLELRRADLRRAFPEDLGQRLTGATVTGLDRRAKYGLIHTDGGDTMVFHLGMSGSWRIDHPSPSKHDHLFLETGEGRKLTLNDPRRFGSVDLLRSDEIDDWGAFKALGPEPFELDPRHVQERLRGRSAAIKLLLGDQRIIAGLGNIYVCEALHRAGIHPKRAAGLLSLERLRRLAAAVEEVLTEAIEAGGSTLKDFVSPDGELGYFSKRFAVYDREGQPCPCGGTVRRIVQGGRSTFYCPKCQH
jgi:formamidopyrimidine-DNA glycosylase